MKTVLLKLSGMWLFFLFTLQALAQTDKKVVVDINVGKNNSNWYQQPWVWVVGGAVFIIILVALLSGRGKKE
jgi:hypothetical protein